MRFYCNHNDISIRFNSYYYLTIFRSELIKGQKEHKRKLKRLDALSQDQGIPFAETELGMISVRLQVLLAAGQKAKEREAKLRAEAKRKTTFLWRVSSKLSNDEAEGGDTLKVSSVTTLNSGQSTPARLLSPRPGRLPSLAPSGGRPGSSREPKMAVLVNDINSGSFPSLRTGSARSVSSQRSRRS